MRLVTWHTILYKTINHMAAKQMPDCSYKHKDNTTMPMKSKIKDRFMQYNFFQEPSCIIQIHQSWYILKAEVSIQLGLMLTEI